LDGRLQDENITKSKSIVDKSLNVFKFTFMIEINSAMLRHFYEAASEGEEMPIGVHQSCKNPPNRP
jgi:hypothetical protein